MALSPLTMELLTDEVTLRVLRRRSDLGGVPPEVVAVMARRVGNAMADEALDNDHFRSLLTTDIDSLTLDSDGKLDLKAVSGLVIRSVQRQIARVAVTGFSQPVTIYPSRLYFDHLPAKKECPTGHISSGVLEVKSGNAEVAVAGAAVVIFDAIFTPVVAQTSGSTTLPAELEEDFIQAVVDAIVGGTVNAQPAG